MDTTAQGILSTLIYHDQFDYPLTRDECWRWWYGGRDEAPTRERVEAACRQLIADGRVLATGGFLHLPKREPIVALRIERAGHNHIKWHNARRAARWLQTVPFFRYLAVCNTVAINNGKPESDVDVFIVARRGRLWLTRALVTAVVQSLGLRRHGTKIANRVCLSFFVTDAALDFSPLLLKPADPYFAFWVAQLVPLYDPDNLSGTIRANNAWVTGSLPNAFSTRPSTPYSLLTPVSSTPNNGS
ncbi:MAG: hypothetical protein HYZ09_03825 [Candidatus Kerfeldbacteria bacterium]|nr:hypothetical protein [Candidatus Kerfeldbacteria bacterium]